MYATENYDADRNLGTAERYFKDGVMQTGFFVGNDGKTWYYADANGVLVKDATKLTLNIPFYAEGEAADRVVDIKDYVLTIREGCIIENKGAADEYANYYEKGIMVLPADGETLLIIDVSENQDNSKIYLMDAEGKLLKSDGVTPITITVDNEEMTYFFGADYLGLQRRS